MKQRGRTSAAALSVANQSVAQIERPAPPAELTSDEAAEWRMVVSDMPADWFRESNLSVLEGYCRTSANCRRIASLITEMTSGESLDIKEYERLLKMQELQHRALLSFATKMRLTQQSTYDREKATAPRKNKKPWE